MTITEFMLSIGTISRENRLIGNTTIFDFEITDNDSIFFYVTDKEKILKTYRELLKRLTQKIITRQD